jgi:protein TonB
MRWLYPLTISLTLHGMVTVGVLYGVSQIEAPQVISVHEVMHVDVVLHDEVLNKDIVSEPHIHTVVHAPHQKRITPAKVIPQAKPLSKEVRESDSDQKQTAQSSPVQNDTAEGSVLSAEAVPEYLSNPAPRYPHYARRQRYEGCADILVDVDAHGSATAVSLHRSSGYQILDDAALEAVRSWRFTPGRDRNGREIKSTVIIPVRFNLQAPAK